MGRGGAAHRERNLVNSEFAGAMAATRLIVVCITILALQQHVCAQGPRRGRRGPRGPRGFQGSAGPPGPRGAAAQPNSWSAVTILQENTTISAANAATSNFVFTAGSCANTQKTATLGGTATVQCFKPGGLPDWLLTAKWLSLSIHNTVVPGDAPACDLVPGAVNTSAASVPAVDGASSVSVALPKTTCPFYARYVYGGNLAAEIGASRCVFSASLYCVKPDAAASGVTGRSLVVGTAASL